TLHGVPGLDSREETTPDDFVGGAFPTGTVTFLPGETSKTVTINVVGDEVFESSGFDELFWVTLSNASSGLVVDATPADGLIKNDETQTNIYASYILGPIGGPPLVSTTHTRLEGNSGTLDFSFVIRRFGLLSPESVTYSVSGFGDNPATASDFVG